jgi:cytochrome c-type biogenesis protein CcmH
MSARRLTRSGATLLAAVLIAVAALTTAAFAGRAAPVTAAEQAHDIASALHCPVCKDLSAADSPAPLARQMREQIRRQLAAGATPAEVRQGFVAAYGPSVLMSPPNRGWGRAVHLAPIVLLAGALLLGGSTIRRGLRSHEATDNTGSAALSTGARRRVEQALAELRREES